MAAAAPEPPPRPRAVAICTDILQGLLLFCVVVWVIDLPRRLFGLAFYTEQLLAVCLGLSLALAFIAGSQERAERRSTGPARRCRSASASTSPSATSR